MATIGVDAEIILDGTGYFVRPASYSVHKPRVRKATIRADNGESYVDLGPGKRSWSMTILCQNDLLAFDGTQIANDGQTLRDALVTSYAKVAQTISFTDPTNTSITVRFDDYIEHVIDIHSQIISPAVGTTPPRLSYEVDVVLVEA